MSVTKVEMTDISSQFAVVWYLACDNPIWSRFRRLFYKRIYPKPHIWSAREKDMKVGLIITVIHTRDSNPRQSQSTLDCHLIDDRSKESRSIVDWLICINWKSVNLWLKYRYLTEISIECWSSISWGASGVSIGYRRNADWGYRSTLDGGCPKYTWSNKGTYSGFTLANHKDHTQYSDAKARGNACEWITIGFWLDEKLARFFFKPIA